MSGFKLNFESQFDILYAIFCFNFSLYWCCSWHTKKKKGNDQDLMKYLINDCSSPPGKFWEIVVPEKRFKACFRSNCLVSNLILKASLTYFMQYFALILAYTGAVAGIQRKRKAMIRI